MIRVARIVPLALGLALLPATLAAQRDARLVQAVRLAQEGMGDSARAVTASLLAATQPTDSLYPEILYTMGSIASTAQEMQRHFQRIAVEHTWSEWVDDAILRLAQMNYAASNPAGAVRDVEKLRTSYPSSPLLPQAALWAGRAYFDLGDPVSACRWLADGVAGAGEDIELRNRLEFYRARCAAVAIQPAESLRPDTTIVRRPTPAPTPPAQSPRVTAGRVAYRVQVAAVATQQAADQVAARVRALGYPAVVVREGGYLKVRAGEYLERATAQADVAKLAAALDARPFVVAEP